MNKVVVRFADGDVLKGFTSDFSPGKQMFHLSDRDTGNANVVMVEKLKAVFIVKEFEGDPSYVEADDFQSSTKAYGSRLKVHFKDGEVMMGVGMGYNKPNTMGFFITPCDENSNTIRAYVINKFVDHIEKL